MTEADLILHTRMLMICSGVSVLR